MDTLLAADRDMIAFFHAASAASDEEADALIHDALSCGGGSALTFARRQRVRRYKRSAFNIVCEKQNGAVVFNSLYNSLCRLDAREYEEFSTLSFSRETRRALADSGLIIDARTDELAVYLRAARASDVLVRERPNVVIAPTTECNARCSYCFEAGARVERMTPETARAAAEWTAALPGAERGVMITWFGGEPLLNTEAIDVFSDRLAELGVEYSAFMITNGTLLGDVDAIEAALRWHLTEIQVTLDGDPAEYASRKNFVDGGGTEKFFAMLGAISEIVGGESDISAQIRLNIDRDNASQIPALARQLSSLFASQPRVSQYPAFISGAPRPMDERERVDAAAAFFEASGAIGRSAALRSMREPPSFTPCHYCSIDAFALDAAGRVYSCERLVGRPERAIGSIADDFCTLENKRAVPPEHERCLSCAYLPKCGGGCRAAFDAGDAPCFEIRYTLAAYLELL